MAELVDAQVSGTCAVKGVEVQILFWAPSPSTFFPIVQPVVIRPSSNYALFFTINKLKARPPIKGDELKNAIIRSIKLILTGAPNLSRPSDPV